ncbi:MAG: DUF3549 family protein [Gammaproteobacteria bacterium]|nr:DUF3549 family protein [Gammaproteobacteria bacterium]
MSDKGLSLLGVLEDSGREVLVYDIGRRIGAIPRESFAAFEAGTLPYPLPMQRRAWIAVVQRVDDAEPTVWFLRLALDEQGLLVPAERDYLLARLLESAQTGQRGGDPEQLLRDNPQAFTPRTDRMALFHARLGADLQRPPSRFYDHALDYFRGDPGWEQWGFVGYQGIADVACRHDGAPLSAAIPHLPPEPLLALCHCLESQRIGDPLRDALIARLQQECAVSTADAGVAAATVRALASRAEEAPVRRALHDLLARPLAHDIEILAAIAGRAWEALLDDGLLGRWLACLVVNTHGQAAFEQCVGDLLSVPTMAEPLRHALRSPAQDTRVRAAFAHMTGAAGAAQED